MAESLNHKIIDDQQTQILEIHLPPHKSFYADAFALLYVDEEILIETRSEEESSDIHEPFQPHGHHSHEEEEEHSHEEEVREKTMLEKAFQWMFHKKGSGNHGEEEEEEEHEHGSNHGHEEEEEESQDEGGNYRFTFFNNESDYIRIVAFSAIQSGKFIRIDLSNLEDEAVIIRKGTFVCANENVKIAEAQTTDYSGKFDFQVERLEGSGHAFLRASGKITEKKLDDDLIQVNLNAIIAYEPSIELELHKAHTFPALYNTHQMVLVALKGSGRIWLQSGFIQIPSTISTSDTDMDEEENTEEEHSPFHGHGEDEDEDPQFFDEHDHHH